MSQRSTSCCKPSHISGDLPKVRANRWAKKIPQAEGRSKIIQDPKAAPLIKQAFELAYLKAKIRRIIGFTGTFSGAQSHNLDCEEFCPPSGSLSSGKLISLFVLWIKKSIRKICVEVSQPFYPSDISVGKITIPSKAEFANLLGDLRGW